MICIAGIKDIIRDEVPDAVKQCNKAGVRVRMVTGDNKITAIAISITITIPMAIASIITAATATTIIIF